MITCGMKGVSETAETLGAITFCLCGAVATRQQPQVRSSKATF
jgi:hypothetical protein